MAIIGKIREKSVLLVIIIGLALLAFILGGYEKMSLNSDEGIGYGTVFGEKIDPIKLQEDIAKFEQSDRTEFQKQQREYTQKDQDASSDKAFNFRVETTILEKEYEALGLDVSDAEFDAYLYGTDGFTVMPDLAQGFIDSLTGQFSAKMLQKTIERLQRIVVDGLEKIAIAHLYSQGIDDSELTNFELELTLPSLIYEQEKVNLWTMKMELICEGVATRR